MKNKKYMKNIMVRTTFYRLDNAINVSLDESDGKLWYNFDTQDTNILFEKIDEDELLRILDEISDTSKYESLFNIVTDKQKEFLNSSIRPILSEDLEGMNKLPLDFYNYVNKYISNKIFNHDNYLITKNEVINFYFNHGSDFNNFKKGQKWTKSNFKQGNKLKIHEFIIAVTYVNLLNHSYMKYINAENYYDPSKR